MTIIENTMNEKTFKILTCVSCALLLVGLGASFAGNVIKRNRLSSLQSHVRELESELERYRDAAGLLAERQRTLEGNLAEARGIAERAGDCIGSIGGSVSEIRRGLAELQEYVERLEDCLSHTGGNNAPDERPCGSAGD